MNGGRPDVVFLSWSFVRGRSAEIAAALGGEARSIYYPALARRSLVLLRYIVSSFHTAVVLLVRRPRAVIVTLPPVFPGLVVAAYAAIARVPFLLDSHPSSFGRKDDHVSRRLLPIHRWLARRAAATMVTTEEWTRVVDAWGGRGVVVHEAPAGWQDEVGGGRTGAAGSNPFSVLFVCVFSSDEPVAEVLTAASLVPDITVRITGDSRRMPDVLQQVPPNVELLGYLNPLAYRDAVAAADAILALTTEPTSIMRAAYEAVYARRSLVASDWPRIRELFPHAVLVPNDAAGIARGLEEARDRIAELASVAGEARALQLDRWEGQLRSLRVAMDRRSRPWSASVR